MLNKSLCYGDLGDISDHVIATQHNKMAALLKKFS